MVMPDGKGVAAPMMMLGFGGAANDKNCWKMNLLPFSKGYSDRLHQKIQKYHTGVQSQ